MNIQWFPGHMTKAIRMMEDNLKLIDIVVELVDARLPISSRNPKVDELVGKKPHLIVLNKSDIADQNVTKLWEEYFSGKGLSAVSVSSTSGKNFNFIFDKCRALLKDKIEKDKEKGIINRAVKIMVCGVPNVGKSSFINKLSGKKSAITGDRPGVTKGKQWLKIKGDAELLDTPGILPPKFEDQELAKRLAYTGAIKDEIMNRELLAYSLCEYLRDQYANELCERYKIKDDISALEGYEVLELIGRRRGFVISGGEVDMERAANMILDELRGCKIGNITLEVPADL